MGTAPTRAARRPVILFIATGQSITATRKWLLQSAGYSVVLARTTQAAMRALNGARRLDLVVIGSFTRDLDLAPVIDAARRRRPKLVIVTLSRAVPEADIRVEPLSGPEALLRVVGEAIVTGHGHRLNKKSCAMFVDRSRRYIHVTDAVAALIGYKREDLLGSRIDDISAPDMDVPAKFKSYIRDGSQHGVFALRHRDGGIVRVRYTATILDDGCMVSRLKKLG